MKKFLDKKNRPIIGAFVGLYLVSAGLSWAAFTFLGNTTPTSITGNELNSIRAQIEAMPKTEECVLNGQYYSEIERDIWEGRRPMGVMIENHLDSRPQSGLSKADVVYEAIAEGGISRFLAMFYCDAAAEDVRIGPIRSARVYFIDWVSEYAEEPLYVHFGGANNICTNQEDPDCLANGTKRKGKIDPRVMALEELIDLGWRHGQGNALDGGANAGAPAIVRDQYRLGDEPAAWEHSAVGSTDLLFDLGIERGFNGGWDTDFTPWQFKDASPAANPEAETIEFEFWPNKGDYDVAWEYDSETNSYLRINGGRPHTDWELDKPQLSARNVVIMFVEEEGPVDEELHMYYETLGGGDAIIFQDGKVVLGTWEKETRTDRTIFYDEDGKEIEFVRGKIWIEAVPDGNEIVY